MRTSQIAASSVLRQVSAQAVVELEPDHFVAILSMSSGESELDGSLYRSDSFDGGATWTPQAPFIDNAAINDNSSYLLWRGAVLWCFYCRKSTPDNTVNRVWYTTSDDGGTTWAPHVQIDTGHSYNIIGQPILLAGGQILVPYAFNRGADSGPNDGYYRASAVRGTASWTRLGTVPDPMPLNRRGLLEPRVVELADGLHMYARTVTGYVWYAKSTDGGATWSVPRPTTHSGVDGLAAAFRLSDGRIVLANHAHHSTTNSRRRPLMLFESATPLAIAERAIRIADSPTGSNTDRYVAHQLGEASNGDVYGTYWHTIAANDPPTIDAYFFRVTRSELRQSLLKTVHGGIWTDGFVNDGSSQPPHPAYKLVGGAWRTTPANRLQYAASNSAIAHALVDAGRPDFAITTLATRPRPSNSFAMTGITFRYADPAHYWRLDNHGGRLRLVKVNGDGGTVKASVAETTERGRWYRYGIWVRGDLIRMYRDGVFKLGRVSDPFNRGQTHAGPFARAVAGEFDSVAVMASFEIRVTGLPAGYAAALLDSADRLLASAAASGGVASLATQGVGVETGTPIGFPAAMVLQVYRDTALTIPAPRGRYPATGHSWDIFGGDVYQYAE